MTTKENNKDVSEWGVGVRNWLPPLLASLTIVACVSFLGCDGKNTVNSIKTNPISELKYDKDKFGICYASHHLGSSHGVLVIIPCEKVGL